MRVFSSKPAISIEFNNVNSNNLAGYEEHTRVLYMIQIFKMISTEKPLELPLPPNFLKSRREQNDHCKFGSLFVIFPKSQTICTIFC